MSMLKAAETVFEQLVQELVALRFFLFKCIRDSFSQAKRNTTPSGQTVL